MLAVLGCLILWHVGSPLLQTKPPYLSGTAMPKNHPSSNPANHNSRAPAIPLAEHNLAFVHYEPGHLVCRSFEPRSISPIRYASPQASEFHITPLKPKALPNPNPLTCRLFLQCCSRCLDIPATTPGYRMQEHGCKKSRATH